MRIEVDVASWMHTHPLADGEEAPKHAALTAVGDIVSGTARQAVSFPIAEPSRTHIHLPDEVVTQEYNDYRLARLAAGQDDEYGSAEEYVATYVRRIMGKHSREIIGLSADEPAIEAHLRARFGVTQGVGEEAFPTTPSHAESADLMQRYHEVPLEDRKPVARGPRLQLVPPATPALVDPEETL